MKDLRLKYKTKDGNISNSSYDTIMDFLDEVESEDVDKDILEAEVIRYVLFENSYNTGCNMSMKSFIRHCKNITS